VFLAREPLNLRRRPGSNGAKRISLKKRFVAAASVPGTRPGHDAIECFVIAGLDPALHGAAPNIRLVSMDRRVKPGGDDVKAVARMERSVIRDCRGA
jgi:hypothetical protein